METGVPEVPVGRRDARLFLVMAWVMAATVIGGFGFNFFMGRSTFSVPAVYHLHAALFIAWTVLYVTQNTLIFRGSIALHRQIGKLAFLLIPLMVVAGIWLTLVTLRMRGGPPVFGQAEFLFVNICHILAFAGLAAWAVYRRRQTDWHRRLMYGAMACVGSPGLARLLPLPLTIPYSFTVVFLAALVFPLIGMIADRRLHGRVHRAWWWTLIIPLAALLAGELIASTEWAVAFTADYVAGTPGGERPPEAFLPPAFM